MILSLHKISDGSLVLLDTQVIRGVETVNKETYVTCTDKVYKVIESVETIQCMLKPKLKFVLLTEHDGKKIAINSSLSWLIQRCNNGTHLFLKGCPHIEVIEPLETVLEMLN